MKWMGRNPFYFFSILQINRISRMSTNQHATTNIEDKKKMHWMHNIKCSNWMQYNAMCNTIMLLSKRNKKKKTRSLLCVMNLILRAFMALYTIFTGFFLFCLKLMICWESSQNAPKTTSNNKNNNINSCVHMQLNQNEPV